jgi:hypothetical protein
MRVFDAVTVLAVGAALFGCAEMRRRAPVEGHINSVSKQDVREIIAVAEAELAKTGRASEPVYSVQIERADYAYAWFGKRRVRYDDTEQAIAVERVKDHWRVPPGLRELVSGSNIPTG